MLPDVGEGLTEADILSWKVAVGDTVAVNDVLVEIETAKSVVELPSPFTGTVEKLHAEEGDTVAVDTPLVTIAENAESSSANSADTPTHTQPDDVAHSVSRHDSRSTVQPEQQGHQGQPQEIQPSSAQKNLVGAGPKADPVKRRARKRSTKPQQTQNTVTVPEHTAPVQQSAEQQERKLLRGTLGGTFSGALSSHGSPLGQLTERASALLEGGLRRLPGAEKEPVADEPTGSIPRRPTLAKPPVRKAAQEMGVDLANVTATGENGQVTKRDLMSYVAHLREEDHEPLPPESFWLPQGVGGDRIERIKVRGVRKATAKAMVDSAFSAPHVSIFVDVDASRTMEFVKSLKKSRHFEGVKVTPLLILAKAVIWATARNPQVNATWTNQEILLKHYMNLGIAAATPRGLMVPNIKEAQGMSLRELAVALNELTARAREGKTQPAEMNNGTLTITNIGALGIDTGTPIINPGEVAIIAFGTIKQKPWVVDGEVIPRWVTTLGGSFDHRVVDGDLSARFMADVAAIMEEPALLLDE